MFRINAVYCLDINDYKHARVWMSVLIAISFMPRIFKKIEIQIGLEEGRKINFMKSAK